MSMLFALALATAIVAALRGMWSPCGLSMLSAVNPLAEAARGHRFAATAAWYVVGAAAGGAALGGVCAAVAVGYGRLSISVSATAMAAMGAALIALAADTGVAGLRLPTIPRQVDSRWLTAYRRWVYASGFGVQIGAGVATYVMTSAVYLTAVLAVLTASPTEAFLVGLSFGTVRGLTIVIAARARTGAQLRTLMARVDRLAPLSLKVARACELAVAVAAGWIVGGPLAPAFPLALLLLWGALRVGGAALPPCPARDLRRVGVLCDRASANNWGHGDQRPFLARVATRQTPR